MPTSSEVTPVVEVEKGRRPAGSTTRSAKRGERKGAAARVLGFVNQKGLTPAIVVVLMIVVFWAMNPSGVTLNTLSTLFDQSAALLMLALAQSLVVLMGRIDLANSALASFLCVLLVIWLNTLGPIAIPLVLLLGVAIGALQGWVHMYFQIPSFVVTLAVSGIVGGAGLIASGASAVSLIQNFELVQWFYESPGGIPLAFVIGAAIAAVLAFFVAKTARGRTLKAIGSNQRATAYSGIRTTVTVVLGFALAGLLIGIAAIMTVGQLGTASSGIANSLLLPSIAAVVVGGTAISGGTGGPGRIVFGALIIALLRIGLDIIGVPQEFQPIVYGVIVIAAIAITVNRSRTLSVV
ncbi:ABC transporter permease [Herbiconiux daphne]|uniref:ABC transporter permease n=1 Tax=Herbiconiux daphne TaxID=2970914 RepID=A0ABT2H462_9MICO|nr:ABC transporter permease [Herbiconiux daphne]MCS5734722.1 ABC transporter permease [Herbiconiux daphne]